MYRFLLLVFLFICTQLKAFNKQHSELIGIDISNDVYQNTIESQFRHKQMNSPNRLFIKIRTRINNSRKITAAVMAFPIPFGIVGLHRIYLGTQPYVPVVYIATVGGCFGILPMIDFIVIILEKDIQLLTNNPRVFMWAK